MPEITLEFIGKKLDEVLREQAETRKAIADLTRLLNDSAERLLVSIDGIRGDLTVQGAANDRTRKAGENTRDEVRELATGLASIERILLKHGTRLDDLEKRVPERK